MKIFRIFAEFKFKFLFQKKKKNFASKEECIVDIFSLFINVQKCYFLSIIFSFRIAHGIYIYILGERLMEISLRRIKPELENYRRRLLTTLTPSTPRLGTTASFATHLVPPFQIQPPQTGHDKYDFIMQSPSKTR